MSIATEPLDVACNHLREEMKKVDASIFTSHDGIDTLEVFGDLKFEAYAPKRFSGWKVIYLQFDHQVQLTLDLDEEIFSG